MMKSNIKIYKGHIIFTKDKDEFTIIENGYIIVKDNIIIKTSSSLPEDYKDYPVIDYGNRLIIPGFTDLHLHAPQFKNRGLCLDLTLIDWLFKCTFPEEAKFHDLDYARDIYQLLIHKLWQAGTTRSVIYNTIHLDATMLLMDMLKESGLGAYVGKVNMDINAPLYIRENTFKSLQETELLLRTYNDPNSLVKPIIAPRFVPSCSSELMAGLGLLALKYNVPVMSHLSEEKTEMKIVHDMYPNFPTYGNIYNYFGLFGQQPTIMAHCIFSPPKELSLIKQNGVFIAHCPASNCHLGSGMMTARPYLDMGIKMGLASDISGGDSVSLLPAMVLALSVSKMISIHSNEVVPPLLSSEAFYLATKGGGAFFGKVGSFEEGYVFDALIIDDSNIDYCDYSLFERIQRFIYLGDDNNIIERYVNGKIVPEPVFDK